MNMTERVKRLTEGLSMLDDGSAGNLEKWLDGEKKMLVICSDRPGAGKSTLAKRVMEYMGEDPVSFRCPIDKRSIDKVVEAAAMKGGVLLFDDWLHHARCLRTLVSGEPMWIRMLGTSSIQKIENNARVIVTGNSGFFAIPKDVVRRACVVMLDRVPGGKSAE